MEMVNRSAVIVKPRQPYLKWTRQTDAEGLAESVFETFDEDPSVYLLPGYEDPVSQQRVLERFLPLLFEGLLKDWSLEEATWPKDRTFERFCEWFEVQMSSVVDDLHVAEPLRYIE